jgi:hypothetical protein
MNAVTQRRARLGLGSIVSFAIAVGCAKAEDLAPDDVSGGTGGTSAQGGSSGAAGVTSGGTSTGGSALGGSTNGGSASGGTSGQGGSSGSAGTTGGTSGQGGSGGSSGSAGKGGSTSSGGSAGSSGSAGKGGTTSSGGSAGSSGAGAGGSGATGALLFEDFEDGVANNWIGAASSDSATPDWAVIMEGGGHVYQQQTEPDQEVWAVGGDAGWTDVSVEVRAQFVSASAPDDARLFVAARFARAGEEFSFYFMEIRGQGDIAIGKVVAGSDSDITSSELPSAPATGTWYTLRFDVAGNTLSASVDGMMQLTATDDEISAGGVAIGVRQAVASFDDVSVTAP